MISLRDSKRIDQAIMLHADDFEERAPLKSKISLVNLAGDITDTFDFKTGELVEIDYPNEAPLFFIPEKFYRIFTSRKRFIILIGGRGGAKSVNVARLLLTKMMLLGQSVFCLREYQHTIKDSVHPLLKAQIKHIAEHNFTIYKSEISTPDALCSFAGTAINPENIKSSYGYHVFWFEEAQKCSETTLNLLTKTLREKDTNTLPRHALGEEADPTSGVSMVFTANVGSREDPFSKRFVNDFMDKLDDNGFYEDDLHLVCKINHSDNPWFPESGLDEERAWDEKHLEAALYRHIWEGDYNDSVENALILMTWFDACIDAHLKIKNFNPHGVKRLTHDPSDTGSDNKALCVRQGNIILDVQERDDLDVNQGCDWALAECVNQHCELFEWDVGGMGIALKRQVNNALASKNIDVHQFNGAAKVDLAKSIYEPSRSLNIKNQKTWEQMCKNLRAQNYLRLRDRVYRTYRAVIFNEPCDPLNMISFSSQCRNLNALRAELCRMPIKPNNNMLFELYSKPEMRQKFDFKSPNLADCVMMSERIHVLGQPNDTQETEFTTRTNYW